MAFILSEERRVFWPVVISEPVDGGKVSQRKIELEFVICDPEKWDGSEETVSEVLQRSITGWKHVMADETTELSFSDERLKQLLRLSYARTAIWKAFTGEVLPGAAAKN